MGRPVPPRRRVLSLLRPPHLPLQAPRERCPRVNDRPPPATAHRGEAFARGFPACPLPVHPPCSLLYKMNAVKCLYSHVQFTRVPYAVGPRSCVHLTVCVQSLLFGCF